MARLSCVATNYFELPGPGVLMLMWYLRVEIHFMLASLRGQINGCSSSSRDCATRRPQSTVITGAEAVCWRCHRSLIADYLKARAVEALHILGANKVDSNPYTPAARIVNGELSYRSESLL